MEHPLADSGGLQVVGLTARWVQQEGVIVDDDPVFYSTCSLFLGRLLPSRTFFLSRIV